MAFAIIGMDVIGERCAESFFDFVAGHVGPGGIEKGPKALVVDLENDLLDVLDNRLISEFARAEGFGRTLALDAHGDAAGDGLHFLKDRLGQRLARKEGHQANEILFENERISGKGDDALAQRPLAVEQAPI